MSTNPTIAAANIKFRELMRQYELLSSRDQMMLHGLGVFVVLILVFFMLVNPALSSVDEARAKLERKQEVLTWMKSNEHLVNAANSNKGGKARTRPTGKTMSSIINSSSDRYKVSVKRLKPDGEDKLHVWLENVEFNNVVKWLNKLKKDYSVTVTNISIDSGKESGFIKAKIILRG